MALLIVVLVVVARILLVGLRAEMEVAVSAIFRLLGQRLGVDIHHRRSHRLAIRTKSFGGIVEFTTFRGVASVLSLCFSCPRTPWAANDPATIAAESVASNTNAEARRRERSRSKSNFIEFNDLFRRPVQPAC